MSSQSSQVSSSTPSVKTQVTSSAVSSSPSVSSSPPVPSSPPSVTTPVSTSASTPVTTSVPQSPPAPSTPPPVTTPVSARRKGRNYKSYAYIAAGLLLAIFIALLVMYFAQKKENK